MHAQESFPFDELTLAFTIGGKIFALMSLDEPEVRINLKCDPDYAVELREQFESIIPGYHMNKKHWNTVFAEKISTELLKKLIGHSYDLVLDKLPKNIKENLLNDQN
ncbi:MAG TPA: MmcQ/YjbR family DNA-binding protein [Saprospiraceae bacterium]|nr:MmcQ/YjbR family DNA-binding protein [Saprospiraceae bacterium]